MRWIVLILLMFVLAGCSSNIIKSKCDCQEFSGSIYKDIGTSCDISWRETDVESFSMEGFTSGDCNDVGRLFLNEEGTYFKCKC